MIARVKRARLTPSDPGTQVIAPDAALKRYSTADADNCP
jgi:hypothetical protein